MNHSYLRLEQVLKRIPVSKSTWWNWCAKGKAPKPVKLAPKTTVWLESEINAFIVSFIPNPRKEGKEC